MLGKQPQKRARLIRWTAVLAGIGAAACLALQACNGSEPPVDTSPIDNHPVSSACSNPAAGCPCETNGQTAACGATVSSSGGQTQCSAGTLTCSAGIWGPCVPSYTTFVGRQKITLGMSKQPELLSNEAGVGIDSGCDPCDPYCQSFNGDNSTGLDGGPGLQSSNGGWILTDATPPADVDICIGNQCYVPSCEAGATQLVGTILDPAGRYPVNNALVMIPNDGIIPPMTDGVNFNPCSGSSLPPALAVATTGPNGVFILGNPATDGGGSVPTEALPIQVDGGDAGNNPVTGVPILVQVGRWRRLVTVAVSNACAVNDAGPIALPSVQGGAYGQDNIPHVAIITSSCDPFECMINTIGVDRTQFSAFGGGGRIELLYAYDQGTINEAGAGTVNGLGNPHSPAIIMLPDGGFPDASVSGYDQLLKSTGVVDNYDLVMLPCRCGDEYEGPSNASGPSGNYYTDPTTAIDYDDINGYRQTLASYANSGGRVFTSHWGREWIERQAISFDAGPGACAPEAGACGSGSTVTQATCSSNPACAWAGGCTQANACPSGGGTTSVSCTSLDAGGDPWCNWNSSSCSQATACPTLDAGTTGAQCTGANGQCLWTGSCAAPSCPTDAGTTQSQCLSPCSWTGTCSAPSCPTGDAGITAATCFVDGGGFNACSFTGSCGRAIGSCPTSPTSKAACTQLDAGGDPQCAWAGSGCVQQTACPTDAGTTAALCTGADNQCNWTGSCSAPSCPVAIDAGALACTNQGCTFTGSCGLNTTTGTCATHATSVGACTNPVSGGDPLCTWNYGASACVQTTACPAVGNGAITQSTCSGGTGGDPQCSWTGSCSAPNCVTADASTTAASCTTPAQGGNAACAYTGTCAYNGAACGANTSLSACTNAGASASVCQFVPNCNLTNQCPTVNTATAANCSTILGGGDPLCTWTGSCSAPACPTGTAVDAGYCATQSGCSFTGSCAVNTATGLCPAHATSLATCQVAGSGGDQQCTWSNATACQQTNACPATNATTQTTCQTGSGDPQCLWTGSCSAPVCTVAVDAGSAACGSTTGCSFTGSCSQATSCSAHATSQAACTQLDAGGDPQCNWTGAACSQTSGCPVSGGTVTQTQCQTVDGGGDPQCGWTGSCVAPSCPSTNTTTITSCHSGSGNPSCSWTGSCSLTASCPTTTTATQASCSGACAFDGGSSTSGNGCVGPSSSTCLTALQTSGSAACTAASCLFDAGPSGGANGCSGASSGTCSGLTGSACTSAGCNWGGGCTSTCTSLLTKGACQSDAGVGCTWSTDNSTCEPTAGACSGSNTSACSSSGSTCTYNGCSSPSCPSGTNVTPTGCTTFSDGGATGCTWTGSCGAPTCATGSGVNAAACTTHPDGGATGCSWVGSCAANASACTGQGEQSTCTAVGLDGGAAWGVGCTWDAGAGNSPNGCTAADAGACSAAAANGENACTTAGCLWDGGTSANGCSAPSASVGCTSTTAEQSQANCAAVAGGGCTWDLGDASTCSSGGGCTVSAAGSESACGAISGCLWDAGANGGNGCADPDAGSCAGYGSKSTCQTGLCLWDAGGAGASANGCTTPGTDAGCNSATAESSSASCGGVSGCYWDAGATTCTGGSNCTTSVTEAACNGFTGCVWDGGASGPAGNGCAATGDASACTTQASESLCNTNNCAWDAGGATATANGCTAPATNPCTAGNPQTSGACLTIDNSTVTQDCSWFGQCNYLDASCPTYGVSEAICNGAQAQSDGGILAGCVFNAGAMGNNGCGGPSSGTCTGDTSKSQCTGAQAPGGTCLWDSGVGATAPNGCSPPGVDAGCANSAAEQSQATCSGLSGCYWDAGATTCSGGTLCADAGLQNDYSCSNITGCIWDAGASGGNGCAGPASCGDAGSQTTCTTAGCRWDGGASGANGCATTGFCTSSSAELSQAACLAVDGGGCGWDAGATSCTGSGNACGVSAAQSELGCGTVDGGGCIWDGGASGGNGCTGPSAATCDGGAGNETTCAADKCIWGGGCSGASASTCNTEGSWLTCGDAGCLWDAGASGGNGCATTGFCTSSGAENSQTACGTVDGGGCVWDGGCTAPAAGTGCVAETSQSTCGTGCNWTGSCTSQCTGPTPSLCTSTNGCSWSGATGLGSGSVPYGWAPFPGVAVWEPDVDAPGNGVAYFNATPGFARGDGLAAWLTATGAFSPNVPFTVGDPKTDVLAVLGATPNFVYGWEPDAAAGGVNIDAGLGWEAGGPNTIYSMTFDPSEGGTDGGAAGRVMFTDMHLSTNLQQTSPPYIKVKDSVNGPIQAPVFNTTYSLGGNLPPNNLAGAHECLLPEAGLPSAEELAAEYLLFDLGACQAIGLPPGFVPQQYLATETFTRDYCVAPSGAATNSGCPVTCETPNSSVVWRDFDWTSIIPSVLDGGAYGPNMQFSFQTAATEAELGLSSDGGGGASPVYTAPTDLTSGSFAQDVNALLGTGNSQVWLRVSMTLNPDSTHQIGPTLASWAQQFDCVPSQ